MHRKEDKTLLITFHSLDWRARNLLPISSPLPKDANGIYMAQFFTLSPNDHHRSNFSPFLMISELLTLRIFLSLFHLHE